MNNLKRYKLSSSIEDNIKLIKDIFKNDDTIKFRRFQNQYNQDIKCLIVFINGMADNYLITENIIKPITINTMECLEKSPIDYLQSQIILSSECEKTNNVLDIINSIIDGDTVLFLEGSDEVITIESKGWKTRDIQEPDVERVVRGPREGFNESIIINLSLIRRKLRTNNLKFKFMDLGEITYTKLCVCYIEGLAREDVLNNLYEQLNNIKTDGILDAKYIQEYISKEPYSVFEITYTTEKPDVAVAKLLEGRIVVIIDGTPVAITLPFLFIETFQSADDYYLNYYYASLNRILRIIGFFLTISIPAIYLSLVTYNQEMVPTPLIMSIYASRLDVPLPTVFELIGLLLVFEILREAGTRMPSYIGQALSIVGALVLGSAAVDAKFVSAPIVIVVGMSGITSLITPTLGGATIIIKIGLILLSSILGLYGYVIGMSFLLLHLLKLKSFGIPYMTNLATFTLQDLKDTGVRAPRWYMKYRPKHIAKKNPIRSSGGKNRE
ncbi:spore germination protein [Tissierella praeacuta]|uniref:spore germination protein n=1 Tax=Tissierella praeacuta TaxID=43131 RepID=UPI003342D77A